MQAEEFDWLDNPLGVEALIGALEKEKIMEQLAADPSANKRWHELLFKWHNGREKTPVDYAVESFLQ